MRFGMRMTVAPIYTRNNMMITPRVLSLSCAFLPLFGIALRSLQFIRRRHRPCRIAIVAGAFTGRAILWRSFDFHDNSDASRLNGTGGSFSLSVYVYFRLFAARPLHWRVYWVFSDDELCEPGVAHRRAMVASIHIYPERIERASFFN